MPATQQAAEIERLENLLGHLIAADMALRMIAQHTDKPQVINEVKHGRGHIAAVKRELQMLRISKEKL